MATYVLPDLPFDYSALEPHVSARLLELHHDRHHAAYVKGANAALEGLEAALDDGDNARINALSEDLAFNLAGHVNHSIFWRNLSPDGGGEPTGELAAALETGFGSLASFKARFGALATGIRGSGWVVLAFDTVSEGLVTIKLHDHQNGLPAHVIPLLVLDMWEHAFYLDYQNDKASFVKAFWSIVNWDDVAARLASARAGTTQFMPM